jgi:hypothetical protein
MPGSQTSRITQNYGALQTSSLVLNGSTLSVSSGNVLINGAVGTSSLPTSATFSNLNVGSLSVNGLSSLGNLLAIGASTIGNLTSINILANGGITAGTLSVANLSSLGSLLVSGTTTLGNVTIPKGTVTQLTSSTTPVTVNVQSGNVVTVSQTLAAQTSAVFVVNDSTITANSVVVANISNYSGTTGLPVAYVTSVGLGVFSIVVSNHHTTAALNGTLTVAYVSF